jgi:cytochrome P450
LARANIARCVALSQRIMPLAPQITATVQAEATFNLARAYLLNGDAGPAAEQLAEQAIALMRTGGNLSGVLAGIVNLARLHALQGRLNIAIATYAQAPQAGGWLLLLDSPAYYAGLADVLRERNDPSAAADLLRQGMELIQEERLMDADLIAQCYLALARLRQTCGDRHGALATLDTFEHLARQRRFVPLLVERSAALRARLNLMQGNLHAAVRWADTSDLHPNDAVDFPREDLYLTFARVRIAQWLAVSDGEFWLRQRRMMQPHFHRRRVAALTDLMTATIGEELATWAPAARSGAPFNLAPAFNRITMNVVVRTLFGTALSARESDAVGAEMAFALSHFYLDALAGALPAWLPIPGAGRFQQARATVDAALYDVIGRVRRGDGGDNTLIAMLLHMVDAETGAQMTDQQLRDEAVTLVLAGYETTNLALAWTCQLLTQHPKVLAKLQAEVDALEGRTPRFADLASLPYASMVIQESMRLRPPAWFYSHAALADDEIDGFAIPARTIVGVLAYMIHRHPDFWEESERFDPERFTPERSASRHRSAWIGFGLGQHQCIGRDFALMEAQLVLCREYRRGLRPVLFCQ